jgi:hypothetical protein
MAEEGNGVAYRGLGDATTVAVQILLETILKDFSTWDCVPQPLKYHDF